MFKKLFLFTILACSLFVNTVKADSPPVPNYYSGVITTAQNTNGLNKLFDCSKAGMHTLSAQVFAGGTATVVMQSVGANPDGTPNMSTAMTSYTLLSATSGASSPLLVPDTAFPFYNMFSTTTGVSFSYSGGCK